MGGLVDYTWKLFGTIEVVDRVGDTGYIHQAQMADFDWFTVKSVFFWYIDGQNEKFLKSK